MKARLALALHGWPPQSMGGTGLYVGGLAQTLRSLGHSVAVISPGEAERRLRLEEREEEGLALVRVHGPPPASWEDRWRRPAAEALLSGWLARWRPEVLHIHHLDGLPIGLPRCARRAGTRVVWTLHDYTLPCARGQLVDRRGDPCPGPTPPRCADCMREQLRLDPFTARIGALLERTPRLRSIARGGLGELGRAGPDAARISDRLESARAALGQAHAQLSPSRDLAARMEALGWARPTPSALPLLAPLAPPCSPPPPGPPRFLFASAILPTKGPHLLLEAFHALTPGAATLTIAGPTPTFDSWPGFGAELKAKVGGTPGARWIGELPHAQIHDLLLQHDVLVLPSTWPENSPIIVREAAALGLRSILSASGGGREIDPLARLVEPGSVEDLSRALEAEVARGRGRQQIRAFPNLLEHARWLVAGPYAADGVGS